MSYIWQDYCENDDYRIHLPICLLTTECSPKTNGSNNRLVSMFGRLSTILDDISFTRTDLDISSMASVIIHYLAQLDLFSGESSQSITDDFIMEEIHTGRYGQTIKKSFEQLSFSDKKLFVLYMRKHHERGERTSYFSEVFFELFGRLNNEFSDNSEFDPEFTELSAAIYFQQSTNTYYCFCAAEQTEYNENRFNLAKMIFADHKEHIKPIWGKYCFGTIGNSRLLSESMIRIGRTQIL